MSSVSNLQQSASARAEAARQSRRETLTRGSGAQNGNVWAEQMAQVSSAPSSKTPDSAPKQNPFNMPMPIVPAFSAPAASAPNPTTRPAVAAPGTTAASTPVSGFAQFTPAGVDRNAAIAYSQAAEAKNYEIDFLYTQAHENWELNYRRGPEPVKPAYHETNPDKIFNHLQAFRYGNVAVPDDGSGYLSVDGYISASPHQQRSGKSAVQLTTFNGSGYEQLAMPSNPATPETSDIFWGAATLPLKRNA